VIDPAFDRPVHDEPPKPRWRGRLHQIAFFCSLPMAVALVAVARGATAHVAVVVYGLSLVGMFGVSAAYHRLHWSPRALVWIRALDHSMIYLLIAGTYTPLALLVLHGAWRFWLLGAVWAGAALGIGLKVFRFDRSHFLTGALYIVLGWLAVVAAPQFVRHLPWSAVVLVVVGGLLYTMGAWVLLRRRPNPRPLVFGYHEVWHSFMVSGSLCHYFAVLLVVLAR
jgi:hemolysin III